MKRRCILAPGGQQRQQLRDFQEVTRPYIKNLKAGCMRACEHGNMSSNKHSHTPMREQQRDCILDFTPLMNKVNIQRLEAAVDLNRSDEIGQLVYSGFMFSPVVRLAPVCRQSFHVGERSAVIPIAGVEFVGEGGQAEFLGEMVEFVVWDGDCVWFDGGVHDWDLSWWQ